MALQELTPNSNKVFHDLLNLLAMSFFITCEHCMERVSYLCIRLIVVPILRVYVTICWQTDKSSMLDEAIEYVKMLKFQLQVALLLSNCPPSHLFSS